MSDRAPADAAPLWSALRRFASWDAVIIAATALFLVVAASTVEHFGTARNAGHIIVDLAPVLLLALVMTLIVATGEIDLSVASTVGLTGAAMGWMWNHGIALETIMPLTVLLGALLGAVNGLFITGFGLPSLAVTIGTLALYRGLAYVVLGDTAVADWPRDFTGWTLGTIGDTGVPNIVVPLIALALVVGLVLHCTPIGRAVYAAGANPVAAAYSGIAVGRLKCWLYVASGAMAGLVGVFWTLRYSSARADNAYGLELTVVAVVLLGGVSIFGGKGRLPGVLAAVVLLTALQNALRLAHVSTETLTVVTGALLIAAVLAPNLLTAAGDALRSRRRRAAASL
ncbi:ABC transporter permease [Glycomyces sp. TRM65418]|uniref:ABC transporter permease n=1 Tax=Glycomyces sp. TRM65418 TaxID=2867006 RepID=UPI001CE6A8D5|nr:ABC transporter permease [Glycomyces sp. TRM65418]MCC3763424.1 ABC transporter permease [Glycomyces sp. TRM65418]QZD57415.1 ABC transporter permease [Glycomyces sp. TRM65418]